jgi:type I restriction enzyme S subunit
MKDSGIPWIGEIPDDWRIETIGSCIKEVDCKNSDCSEDNALQFKMGTIISKKNGDSKYNPETLEAYNKVQVGDIIINGLNLSFDLISQRVGLVKETGVITSAYLAVRPLSFIDSRFLTYLFKGYDTCKALHSMGKGLRQTLGYKEFRRYYVIFPNLEEQQRIADFLDQKCGEVDEMVSLQEKIIEELKAYKQAIITEAVCKGLNPDAEMKDSGVEWIGKIPEGWEVEPFKQLYELGKGLSITKADLVQKGIPVISYGQIHSKSNTGTAIKDELIRLVPDYYLEGNASSLVKVGDLIFADTSEDLDGCGNCIYIDRDITMFAGYHTIIAKYLNDNPNNYFSYLFKTDCWRIQIRSVVNGVKVFSVPQRLLGSTSVIVPPIEEQKAIGKYLDSKCSDIDAMIAIKQQKIEELKDYKKSIIYEYITGKKEVV